MLGEIGPSLCNIAHVFDIMARFWREFGQLGPVGRLWRNFGQSSADLAFCGEGRPIFGESCSCRGEFDRHACPSLLKPRCVFPGLGQMLTPENLGRRRLQARMQVWPHMKPSIHLCCQIWDIFRPALPDGSKVCDGWPRTVCFGHRAPCGR